MTVFGELIRRHLPDLQPPEEYGCAVVQRTEVWRLKDEEPARDIAGHDGRSFERLEVIARNPDNTAWLKTVDTFVIDEFHFAR